MLSAAWLRGRVDGVALKHGLFDPGVGNLLRRAGLDQGEQIPVEHDEIGGFARLDGAGDLPWRTALAPLMV